MYGHRRGDPFRKPRGGIRDGYCIDESYKGDNDEWNFIAHAIKTTIIPKGERICQFRIIKHQPKIKLVEVNTLGNPDRGGIGSTGRK